QSVSSARSVSPMWATANTSIPRSRAARATSRGKTPLPAISPSLATCPAYHPALGAGDEVDQAAHFRYRAVAREHLSDRVIAQQLGIEERTEGALERGD